MEEDLRRGNQKVPKKTTGSLTPVQPEKEDFPVLPLPEQSPFRRSSLLARSPPEQFPSNASGTVGLYQGTIQETPKGRTDISPEVSPEEKSVEFARENIDAEFRKMRAVLLDMQAATERQKNVNHTVKAGLVSLESSLDLIDSLRKVWKISHQRLSQQCKEKQTQAPSPSMATASVVAGKRQAGSPPEEPRVEKRQKDAGKSAPAAPEDKNKFHPVLSKKERKKAKAREKKKKKQEETPKAPIQPKPPEKTGKTHRSRPRNQVVLVKPTLGRTYAEILGAMRSGVTLEESGTVVRHIRKTASGGVLLELAQCKDRGKLQEAIRKSVGDKGEVRSIVPKSRIEILDLDALATEADITESLKKDFPTLSGELKVTLFKPNRREQRKAVVEMEDREVTPVLQKGKVKVGWVVCRVRKRVELDRCFRCLGYGHARRNCSGPDRSMNCWKCGSAEHKAAGCSETPSCILCAGTPGAKDHVPGSGACGAFRKALAARKASTQYKK